MSALQSIRKALEVHLNSVSAIPTLAGKKQIAWENVLFTPAIGTMWVRPSFAQVEAPLAAIGIGAPVLRQGVFTINVFGDKNKGVAPLEALATEIEQNFKAGTFLTQDGYDITISEGSIRNGIVIDSNDGWVQIPIVVNWRCYQPN